MWIKICGITSVADAGIVVSAGADAIGLNFYPMSPRFVCTEQARLIADSVGSAVDIVGVFVNMPLEDMLRVVDTSGLNAVQFHGDETTADIAAFQQERPRVAVIRALRLNETTGSLDSAIRSLDALEEPVSGILVDAFVRGEYGGTGETVKPELIRNHAEITSRLVLAGGLRPDNVAEIAGSIMPWGVDTASGVEESPGRKSRELIERFVSNCRNVSVQECSIRL